MHGVDFEFERPEQPWAKHSYEEIAVSLLREHVREKDGEFLGPRGEEEAAQEGGRWCCL